MITHAAIKYKGRLYIGKRHNVIICEYYHQTGIKPYGCVQGFVDDKLRFMDRKKAAKHAVRCGQVRILCNPPFLNTEDLW